MSIGSDESGEPGAPSAKVVGPSAEALAADVDGSPRLSIRPVPGHEDSKCELTMPPGPGVLVLDSAAVTAAYWKYARALDDHPGSDRVDAREREAALLNLLELSLQAIRDGECEPPDVEETPPEWIDNVNAALEGKILVSAAELDALDPSHFAASETTSAAATAREPSPPSARSQPQATEPAAAAPLKRIIAADPQVRALSWVGYLALPVAMGAGLLLGAQDNAIYSSSLATVAVLAAIAGFGTAFGLSAWLGFVLGDLLLRDPATAEIWGARAHAAGFTHLYGPLAISYLVLAGLLVFSPLLARRLSERAVQLLASRGKLRLPGVLAIAGGIVQVATQALYATGWIRTPRALIRPLFEYGSPSAHVASTGALQAHGYVVVLVTIAAATASASLLALRGRDRARGPVPGPSPPIRPHLPLVVLLLLQAALLTFLFSGLVSAAPYIGAVGGGFVVLLLLRFFGFPRLDVLVAVLGRIPLLVRLILLAAFCYKVIARSLAPHWHATWVSPIVITIGASLLASGILIAPELRRRRKLRTWGSRSVAASAAVALLLTLLIVSAAPPPGVAASVPWWKYRSSRSGDATGSFTWHGYTSGGVANAHLSCSYFTGDPLGGYAEFQLLGGSVSPGGAINGYAPIPAPKAGSGDIFIHIHEATRPGSYTTGAMLYFSLADLASPEGTGFDDVWMPSDGPKALVGLAGFEAGGVGDGFSSVPPQSGGGINSHGTVVLRADGSGTLSALLDDFSSGSLENIHGSWGPCSIHQVSGRTPAGGQLIPTLNTIAVEHAAEQDSKPNVLLPLIGLAIPLLFPELFGLGAAEGLGAADAGLVGETGVETTIEEPTTGSLQNLIGADRYGQYGADASDIRLASPELHSLSDHEIIAIRGYTEISPKDYRLINSALRGQDPTELARLNPYIREIDSGLAKLPDYQGNVFRGTDLTPSQIERYQAAAKTGEPFTESGFTSATKGWDMRFRGNTEYVIDSLHGKDVTNLAVPGEDESEVLFRAGTPFKVESVREWMPGRFEIFMREMEG